MYILLPKQLNTFRFAGKDILYSICTVYSVQDYQSGINRESGVSCTSAHQSLVPPDEQLDLVGLDGAPLGLVAPELGDQGQAECRPHLDGAARAALARSGSRRNVACSDSGKNH